MRHILENGGRMKGFVGVTLVAFVAAAGCTLGGPDVDAAREFEEHPLYWVGERFENWDIEHVAVRSGGFATFGYGTCDIDGFDGGCAQPLQIQIQPLCAHLDDVARTQIWQTRKVRGAPVGTIDGAPVLFTDRVQIKVYRGQDSDPGLPIRALRALRSVNSVEPVLDVADPIPAPPSGVLAGTKPCQS
jgi:hypothetical protein